MLLGKPEDAIEILQPIAEAAGNYMLKARHAVGTAYLHISMIDNADLILKINEDVLNDIQVDHELTPEVKSEIITAVYYNIGQVYSALNRTAEARSAFNSAHNAAVTAFKPAAFVRPALRRMMKSAQPFLRRRPKLLSVIASLMQP